MTALHVLFIRKVYAIPFYAEQISSVSNEIELAIIMSKYLNIIYVLLYLN